LSDKTRNATKRSGKAVEKLDDEHHMLCMFQHSVQKPFLQPAQQIDGCIDHASVQRWQAPEPSLK